MSTHSAIARKNKDGSYTGIYCHWDGYPSNNGNLLLEHYQNDEKIDALIALGDISSLNEFVTPDASRDTAKSDSPHKKVDLTKPHSYNNAYDDTVLAYCRDRGEEFNQTKGESLIDVLCKIDHAYAYVWIDGKWEVWGGDWNDGISIEEAIKTENEDS
jgi:hypothetical protein